MDSIVLLLKPVKHTTQRTKQHFILYLLLLYCTFLISKEKGIIPFRDSIFIEPPYTIFCVRPNSVVNHQTQEGRQPKELERQRRAKTKERGDICELLAGEETARKGGETEAEADAAEWSQFVGGAADD